MKMPKNVLPEVYQFLKGTSTFPLSLLLIGLEKLIEVEFFSCPCRVELNGLLTASIFIGPALFIFALMYIVFRPFKHGLSCYGEANNDSQHNDAQQNSEDNAQEDSPKTPKNCPKAFAFCLIPPVIWIFILLLDGEYVACSMTDWKGVYVFDQDLNKFWCNPTDKMQNVTELRDLTRKYIYQSQYTGYVLISVFSGLTVAFVSIYDCCISRKCDDYCPNQMFSCCKPTTETQSVVQAVIANSATVSSSTTGSAPSTSVSHPPPSTSVRCPPPSTSVRYPPPSTSVNRPPPSSSVNRPPPSSSVSRPPH